MKIGCVIDMSLPASAQKPRALVQPNQKPVRVTEEHVEDKATLARVINGLQDSVAANTLAARAQPMQAPVVLENYVFNATGATNPAVIHHGFGRYARWTVWDWCGASGGPSLVCDRLDTAPITSKTLLCIKSFVAGTGTLVVF